MVYIRYPAPPATAEPMIIARAVITAVKFLNALYTVIFIFLYTNVLIINDRANPAIAKSAD